MRINDEDKVPVSGYTSDGQKYEDTEFTKEKREKMSLKEIKEGIHTLNSQGKAFRYFVLMAFYFLFLIILNIVGVMPSWLVTLLVVPVVIAIFVMKRKYKQDKNPEDRK